MIAEFAFVLAVVTLGQAVEGPAHARLARVCPKVDSYWTTFLRDLRNCRGYYRCSNGRAIWQQCPPGLFFHPRLLVCDIPRNTGCRIIRHLEENIPQEDEPYVNDEPTQDLDEAEDEAELNYLDEIAPKDESYVNEESMPALNEAEGELDLDEIPSDIDQDVNEESMQRMLPPWRYRARLAWRCPQRDGYWPTFVPHAWDCSKYYECSNGRPILQRCPYGLRFNNMKLICDRRENVSCLVRRP